MSLIPAFEIGVWNAWIFTVFIFLCVLLSQFIKGVGEKIAHDEEEKKLNRDREALLVKEGKKSQFINLNIPNAFASDNHEAFREQIEWAKDIALGTPDKGISSALAGMKARPDRRDVIKNSIVPVMIIAGKKDNYIPFSVYEEHFNLASQTDVLILENSGHMGFIEEREKSLDGILKFLDKIYQ